jgi:transcriptional regulator with XRE-family HTH domain
VPYFGYYARVVTLTRLKLLRERKALTQQALADKAGLNRTTVARLEGGRDQPFPTTVHKLSEALGVEPGELIGPAPVSTNRLTAAGSTEPRRFFGDHPELAPVVAEAVEQIAKFMPGSRIKYETLPDPEYGGEEGLFIGIVTGRPVNEALEALARFDREWWGHNGRRGKGLVCIDLGLE